MKSNIIKYIFIIFAIGIIVFAIYKVSNQQENQNMVNTETQTQSNTQNTESILSIGISDFDNY